jgi:type II secretory ATPase GspE/PulE/Tfp pilus assembly ATPase PilB-like protein
VTIEDPVEYQAAGISQMQADPHRSLTFAEALKRGAPIGPRLRAGGRDTRRRDRAAAADAAAAGRVLMSTLHSPDAVGTITSLRNYGLSDEAICSAVRIVVAQRLLRRLCPVCRRQEPPAELDAQWLKALGAEPVETVWVATGCDACHGIGYTGRVGVFEVWQLTDGRVRSCSSTRTSRYCAGTSSRPAPPRWRPRAARRAAAGVTQPSQSCAASGVPSTLARSRAARAASPEHCAYVRPVITQRASGDSRVGRAARYRRECGS